MRLATRSAKRWAKILGDALAAEALAAVEAAAANATADAFVHSAVAIVTGIRSHCRPGFF